MTVAGLLLAGGGGSRFEGGGHKLLAPFRGRPLSAWSLAALVEARASGHLVAAYVVTGSVSLRPALEWLIRERHPTDPGVDGHRNVDSDPGRTVEGGDDSRLAAALGLTLVANVGWADGQATSLQVGVARAAADGHGAVVVGLADQPFVPADAWIAVARAGGPIAVATFGGLRRPPVKLDHDVWSLLPATGDEGARSLLRMHPELVSEVACKGNPIDIDTMEDFRRWS